MKDLIRKLHANTEKISAERKFDLDLLVQAMYELHKNCGEISVNVICTHNSRRSQVAQLWFIMAAHHFDVPCLKAYSGGTEVTAFNDRMVKALQSHEIDLSEISGGTNPVYALHIAGAEKSAHQFFSKTYDDPVNPAKEYIALIVCDSADEKCPIVVGASHRLFIPYVDPKQADDTDQESHVYRAKVEEIGIEILYTIEQLKKLI